MVSAFCAVFKEYFPMPRLYDFPILSSRGFVILPFTVRSVIHLELIFVSHMR